MYAEDLEVKCEDSRKISKEIDDLRSQLGRKVKELDYCKENNKLRAELCLKTKELECLRKQNEELEAKNEGFQVPKECKLSTYTCWYHRSSRDVASSYTGTL